MQLVPSGTTRRDKAERIIAIATARRDSDSWSVDSDDPSTWSDFYWLNPNTPPSPLRFALDWTKYLFFHCYIFVRFIGEVLVHFFGLHKSRFQWAVDLVEEQNMRLEREAVERLAAGGTREPLVRVAAQR